MSYSFFQTPTWDLKLFWWVNHSLKNPFLDKIIPFFSSPFLGIGLALVIGLIFWSKTKKHILFFLLIVVLTALCDLSANVIKKSIGRIRPLNSLAQTYFVEDHQWQKRPNHFQPNKTHGSSFFSSHAANTLLVCLLLGWRFPKLGFYLLPIPLLVGFSRVYLGKHYPSDVLMGYVWGIIFFLLFLALYTTGTIYYGQTSWFKRIFRD